MGNKIALSIILLATLPFANTAEEPQNKALYEKSIFSQEAQDVEYVVIPVKVLVKDFVLKIETAEVLLPWLAPEKTWALEQRLNTVVRKFGLTRKKCESKEVALLLSDVFIRLEKADNLIEKFALLESTFRAEESSRNDMIVYLDLQWDATTVRILNAFEEMRKIEAQIATLNQQKADIEGRLPELRKALAHWENEVRKATFDGMVRVKRKFIFDFLKKDKEVHQHIDPPSEVTDMRDGTVREINETQRERTKRLEEISKQAGDKAKSQAQIDELKKYLESVKSERERLKGSGGEPFDKFRDEFRKLIDELHRKDGGAYINSQLKRLWQADSNARLKLLEKTIDQLEMAAQEFQGLGIEKIVLKSQ